MTIYHPLRKSEEAAEPNDDDDDGEKARITEIVKESSSKSDAPLANLCFSFPVCQQSPFFQPLQALLTTARILKKMTTQKSLKKRFVFEKLLESN